MSPDVATGITVSQAIAVFNQILDTATPTITVIGEVANYKVNQGKWVFFDLKDDEGILSCFMPLYQVRVAIEDGMKIIIQARPSVTKWGRFSLTVRTIKPYGEGAIKKSFELLRKKLTTEGLFDSARKHPLPVNPQHIGIISSVDAAGYRDFIKIISSRMGGLQLDVISTQVQGAGAADQIIAAIQQFNGMAVLPQVLVIIRGGGSRDDLAVFDDEKLVRAIAASRIPVMTGIGHEVDVTLADLVADKRASTPSNAAELLVMDRRELIQQTNSSLRRMVDGLIRQLDDRRAELVRSTELLAVNMDRCLSNIKQHLETLTRTLIAYDPRAVLQRGYAILWDQKHHLAKGISRGDFLIIETATNLITAEVKDVTER